MHVLETIGGQPLPFFSSPGMKNINRQKRTLANKQNGLILMDGMNVGWGKIMQGGENNCPFKSGIILGDRKRLLSTHNAASS